MSERKEESTANDVPTKVVEGDNGSTVVGDLDNGKIVENAKGKKDEEDSAKNDIVTKGNNVGGGEEPEKSIFPTNKEKKGSVGSAKDVALTGGAKGGGQKDATPEIMPVARPLGVPSTTQHPLQYSWSFWYLKGDRTKDWVDCLRKIADFDTVEGFFSLYNYIQPASTLSWGSDYYLFKTGIQPMWEDPYNIRGGRWLASIEKNQRHTKLDDSWLELLMAVVGEQFAECGTLICGAAVNIRQKGDKVALWTRYAEDEYDIANMNIGTVMAEKLGSAQLQYVVHKDSSSKRGSTLRPKLSIAAAST